MIFKPVCLQVVLGLEELAGTKTDTHTAPRHVFAQVLQSLPEVPQPSLFLVEKKLDLLQPVNLLLPLLRAGLEFLE